MEIRIAGTVNDSIVDGPGLRFTIFVQGCPNHCKGCHNPHTHDFSGGTVTDTEKLLSMIKQNPLLDGVTFSGGEPFCQAKPLAEIGRKVHEMGLNVVTYTGYMFESLYWARCNPEINELLQVTDVLIDGAFILEQQSYQLKFRGSKNQRIIDCRASLEKGVVVEVEDD